MDTKRDVWLRLRNYNFDHIVPPHLTDHVLAAFGGEDASTRAFADKLARKLGWSRPFALGAINEYRKFIFLGMVADFPVTPPKVIDQVWHEHLLFTRAYREFCDKILRREFDHHPELVPMDQQTATFQAQYAATCDLYETEFNRAPPPAYWGVSKLAGRPQPETSPRLRRREDGAVATASDDTPLYRHFSGSDDGSGHSHANMPEFGGGHSGGAGGSGSFPDPTSSGGHGGHGGHGGSGSGHGGHGGHGDSGGGHGDSGGGHGGSDGGSGDGGGGDGGGGDGGGGGCSSGCGGGGCGSG